NNKGFSLIELVITITVVGILSLLLGTSLQGRMGAYRLEGEVKQLKTDLMAARARAMQRNVIHFIDIVAGANNYQMYQDANNNGTLETALDIAVFPNPKVFADPVLGGNQTITLDTRGLISGGAMVSFNTLMNSDYDCLALSPTRIDMGQLNGAICNAR
ncbi:MAG: pilus assembly FimT family protein, partial [Planctomycetota bacterium]